MEPIEHAADPANTARLEPSPRDGVGELVRLAGQRPEISADRTAMHRAAARDYWQHKVALRRRRRWRWMGLAAASAVALVLCVDRLWLDQQRPAHTTAGTKHGVVARGQEPETFPSGGEVAQVQGSEAPPSSEPRAPAAAQSQHDPSDASATLTVEKGDLVQNGRRLETGPESRAAVRLASGYELRLDLDTRLDLVAESTLVLEHGAVYVDSQRASADAGLEIRTHLGVASDVGTRFEVRISGANMRVRVRDGLVNVISHGRIHEAGAAVELLVDAAGTVERRSVPVYGPDWQWSLEIAPAFDIEGRTLREFLAWVSRETGWRLRFHNPAVAAGTGAVVLSGSIEGLTPADALAVVLPTSGLRHRVVEDVLIIEPIQGTDSGAQ